jgi:hypothetical protein
MGVIKTALEIALEKTENIKSDKSSIDQFDAKQQGKKLANAFLAGEADLAAEIKKTIVSQLDSLKQGVFDVLITQIALPVVNEDEERLEKTGKGLEILINNKQFSVFYQQLTQIIARYLQEAAHYEQVIRQQYAPKLHRKEEELSRQLGREIKIDPLQDPEFVAFYNQNMTALKGNYEEVIEQAKEETRRFFAGE